MEEWRGINWITDRERIDLQITCSKQTRGGADLGWTKEMEEGRRGDEKWRRKEKKPLFRSTFIPTLRLESESHPFGVVVEDRAEHQERSFCAEIRVPLIALMRAVTRQSDKTNPPTQKEQCKTQKKSKSQQQQQKMVKSTRPRPQGGLGCRGIVGQ